jgi:hypothetical protein
MENTFSDAKAQALIKKLNNSFFFRTYLFMQLPVAFYSGIKLHHVSIKEATASVPFKRFTKNPFRSTYFACLAMAAELTTGILGLIALKSTDKKVSMLVLHLEASYFKKAIDTTFFTCVDGDKIRTAIQQSITTGEAVEVKCESIGKNKAGELVATFYITWSFKVKS